MTDREQLLALYQACFPEDEPDFWNWVFDNLYTPENTLNVRKDGRIIASLQMIPCAMRLGERLFDAHYIYAASTLPEEQGKGLMAGLLELAAREGRRRGHDFSVLITQEDSLLAYYARFGYKPAFCIGTGVPEAAASKGIVRVASADDIPVLNTLYKAAATGFLHGHRDARHWTLQLELFGTGAKVLERNGAVVAYAFADERGILEAVGPEAAALAAEIQPDRPFRTVPDADRRPMGSVRPLNDDAKKIVEQNPCFLNLMYN
ncbi:MAG: GNAT family N-acetyltransferase [Clostridia bacterium]|nr:GNAT family N-acetyltransferase [Clostridia bacterium]